MLDFTEMLLDFIGGFGIESSHAPTHILHPLGQISHFSVVRFSGILFYTLVSLQGVVFARLFDATDVARLPRSPVLNLREERWCQLKTCQ